MKVCSSAAMQQRLMRFIAVRDHLTDDVLGGPKILTLASAIHLQKGGMLVFVIALLLNCCVDMAGPARQLRADRAARSDLSSPRLAERAHGAAAANGRLSRYLP
jgi:hypothetical protein